MDGNTCILGAGIIGCATAYYLSSSPSSSTGTQPETSRAKSIHLIDESDELFNCASGLAGGFLAADWFAPSVAPLGALSFKLHRELAEEHNGKELWGYSRSTGTSLSQESDVVGGSGEDWLRDGTTRANAATNRPASGNNVPNWLTMEDGASLEVISADDTTAQVDPKRLCQFLLKECLNRGVQLHKSSEAVSISKDADGKLSGIKIASKDGKQTDIPCTRIVLSAGAWTPKVFTTLFPHATIRLPVTCLAGHSLLVRTPRWTPAAEQGRGCHAVFATDTLGFSPELFSRHDAELYVAGLNSSTLPLPSGAAGAVPRPEALAQLRDVARRMLGADGLEVLRESLCFRPVTPSGRPLVSRVPDARLGRGVATRGEGEGGVFVAAGHGAWGISQSLGTGLVMAELVLGVQPSVNVKALELV